jgi:hypothetical protein
VNVGDPQAGAGAQLIFTDVGGVTGVHRYYRMEVDPE